MSTTNLPWNITRMQPCKDSAVLTSAGLDMPSFPEECSIPDYTAYAMLYSPGSFCLVNATAFHAKFPDLPFFFDQLLWAVDDSDTLGTMSPIAKHLCLHAGAGRAFQFARMKQETMGDTMRFVDGDVTLELSVLENLSADDALGIFSSGTVAMVRSRSKTDRAIHTLLGEDPDILFRTSPANKHIIQARWESCLTAWDRSICSQGRQNPFVRDSAGIWVSPVFN